MNERKQNSLLLKNQIYNNLILQTEYIRKLNRKLEIKTKLFPNFCFFQITSFKNILQKNLNIYYKDLNKNTSNKVGKKYDEIKLEFLIFSQNETIFYKK
jgi:hypothetical protein